MLSEFTQTSVVNDANRVSMQIRSNMLTRNINMQISEEAEQPGKSQEDKQGSWICLTSNLSMTLSAETLSFRSKIAVVKDYMAYGVGGGLGIMKC